MRKCLLVTVTIAVALSAFGCPHRQAGPQPGEMVGQLPDKAGPRPGPAAAGSPAPAPAREAKPAAPAGTAKVSSATEAPASAPPPADSKPLTDGKFVALSAKLVLFSQSLSDTEADRVKLDQYTAQVLRENGVTFDQFRDYTARVRDDPKRATAIAERIQAQAREWGSPKVKVKGSGTEPLILPKTTK